MVHHSCYLILSVIMNASWLVLHRLPLALQLAPWRVLGALRQELADPGAGVPQLVQCSSHCTLCAFHNFQAVHCVLGWAWHRNKRNNGKRGWEGERPRETESSEKKAFRIGMDGKKERKINFNSK